MSAVSRLRAYREKRDFRRTPEPKGGTSGQSRVPRFVVQKHQATTLHYDFRLQVGSVLKSWAVPKGPSLDPNVKRLAIATEDHPLEYQTFEGIIPEGEYGAGTVIVWDAGTFRNITQHDGRPVPLEQGLHEGHIAVWLNGKKLKGGFALTRVRRGKQDIWLLVKMQDAEAAPGRNLTKTQPRSVGTGRTLEEVAPGTLDIPVASDLRCVFFGEDRVEDGASEPGQSRAPDAVPGRGGTRYRAAAAGTVEALSTPTVRL